MWMISHLFSHNKTRCTCRILRMTVHTHRQQRSTNRKDVRFEWRKSISFSCNQFFCLCLPISVCLCAKVWNEDRWPEASRHIVWIRSKVKWIWRWRCNIKRCIEGFVRDERSVLGTHDDWRRKQLTHACDDRVSDKMESRSSNETIANALGLDDSISVLSLTMVNQADYQLSDTRTQQGDTNIETLLCWIERQDVKFGWRK